MGNEMGTMSCRSFFLSLELLWVCVQVIRSPSSKPISVCQGYLEWSLEPACELHISCSTFLFSAMLKLTESLEAWKRSFDQCFPSRFGFRIWMDLRTTSVILWMGNWNVLISEWIWIHSARSVSFSVCPCWISNSKLRNMGKPQRKSQQRSQKWL